ncbi:myotubularin-related protein 14 [Zootermopsis nevadensis]|uniref:myotubularin-related protein 14 n=1 Tax=Zootermopsis nevadensis TaxID=136037 RepID=UPI000B8E7384|nr:myotubularin-related protein 14 [Zootermopsis nevadensis]
MEEVKQEDVHQLLEHFSKCLYKAKEADSKSQDVMQRCLKLVTLDYSHVVISNIGGELSANYPSHLIILEYERPSANVSGNPRPSEPPRTTGTIYENMHDATKLRELFGKSRFARCRARFPLPVILYRGKHICRSSTLSGGPEIYGRSGLDYLFSVTETSAEDEDEEVMGAAQTQKDWQLFDRVRSQDIRLLKTLNVGTIIDFMVEKKKVKFGMNVTSSEKVDKENRYSDFTIVSLPYPGCEFFKEYRDNDYVAKGLVFDWTQSHVDAVIGVPDDAVSSQLKIDWEKYKVWDLVKLTQNYMKLLLRYLQENSTGLLIHCISGWDRTPLFISLLRLSLWADGAVHQSLDANQILYFTIAYDWMLFGHNLMDRLSKGEDIFFFCFYFLKHLVGDEYSVAPRSKSKQNVGGGGSSSAAAVLRNDSDLHLDGMLFDADCAISSRGSNISLNSSCSSVSSKSQENPPVLFHNVPDISDEHTNGNLPIYNAQTTWPPHLQPSGFESALPGLGSLSNQGGSGSGPRSPHPSRTSPVAVPVASRFRQRNDSNSSLSVGSWQLISGTGSLRGSASASTSTGDSATPNSLLSQNSSNTSLCEGQISTESSTTIVEDECFIYNSGPADTTTLRRERLQTVRTLFYNAYCSTVGFKFKNGQDSGLGSLLGNFAEKVGIISTQRTSV